MALRVPEVPGSVWAPKRWKNTEAAGVLLEHMRRYGYPDQFSGDSATYENIPGRGRVVIEDKPVGSAEKGLDMDRRGKQLQVPAYALEDVEPATEMGDIGSFGYDGDAFFDDEEEFADVEGSVLELTNRGYKLARRVISKGGSVSDILSSLESLYIKPPDNRTANPDVSSYAFSNIMLLLENEGLIRTEKGMPVEVIYRPPASREVFEEADPDKTDVAGLMGFSGLGQYATYKDEELVAALLGARKQAQGFAAKQRAALADPSKKARFVRLAAATTGKVVAEKVAPSVPLSGLGDMGSWWSAVTGAVGGVVNSAVDYATDVVVGQSLGTRAAARDNLAKLEAEVNSRAATGQLTPQKAAELKAVVADTKATFNDPVKDFSKTLVDETAKNLKKGLSWLGWAKKYGPWIAGGIGVLVAVPYVMALTAPARRMRKALEGKPALTPARNRLGYGSWV